MKQKIFESGLGWLALWLCFAVASQTVHAANRVALVVGNAAYAERPLRNPINDAELMQRTLQGLGFEVQLVRNADRRAILAGLRDFEAKARGAEVALFFFAGHGTQVGGNNYLLPLSAQIRAESDIPDEAVDANSVLRRIEDAKARVGLVILDACRDNPYAGSSRSSSRGLGRMTVPTGSIVAYATAPGSTADDGNGVNGVYTEQLAKHLSTPGLDVREIFDRTAVEVERITNGKQKPREDIGLRGRMVLRQGAGNAAQVASLRSEAVPSTPQPGQAGGVSFEDLEKEEGTRKQWAQWQARMKADFDKTAAFSGSADLQAKAWERFLGAWAQDNPLSSEDDDLRTQAQSRKEQAQRLASASINPKPEPNRPVQTQGQSQPVVVPLADPDMRFPGGRPISIVVPYAAGGSTDIVARTLAQNLSVQLGVPVIIDNKPGSAGNIGADFVSRAASDGYTLMMHGVGIAMNPALLRNAKSPSEFETLGLVAESPMVLAASPRLPISSWNDLGRYLQANGSRTTYGSGGLGSLSHLCGVLVGEALGAQMSHVPYRGAAPALTDLMGGQIDLFCESTTTLESQIASGKVKAIGVAPLVGSRTPATRNLPSLRLQQDTQLSNWTGLYAPRGIPAGIVSRLNRALQQAVQTGAVREKLESIGALPVTDSRQNPAVHRQFLDSQSSRMTAVLRSAGVTPE